MPTFLQQASDARPSRPAGSPDPNTYAHVWFVALFVGALIWLGYVYATAVIELGLCGTGVRGVRVGWTHENGSYIVAAVIGAVLWAAGVFATSRSPRRKWLILGVYGIAYVGALILFATAIAPAIWGAASCELY